MGKYILRFGERRLKACKKLLKQTIPAINELGEIKEVPIKDIEILDNTRIRVEEDESFQALMQDIKTRGVLQPIGIVEKKGFSTEKFLADNFAENFHRKDYTPIEIATLCKRYKEMGYNNGEISVLLSIPKSRIVTALEIERNVPEEYKKDIVYKKSPRGDDPSDAGKMSVTLTNALANVSRSASVPKKEIKHLWRQTKQQNLTVEQLTQIGGLLRAKDMTVKKAIKSLDKLAFVNIKLVCDKKELAKYNVSSYSRLFGLIAIGKIPQNPKLVLLNKEKEKSKDNKDEED